MQQVASITVTIPNPTAGQLAALTDIMNATGQSTTASTTATPTKKRGRPAKTVSPEEEESFGKKELDEEDLADDGEEEEEQEEKKSAKSSKASKSEDEDEEETDTTSDDAEDEEEDEESEISFDEVKAALNKLGNKKPDVAKSLLLSFNIKTTKELQQHTKKWEPVYRKVMAKLAALKKAK